MKGPTLSLDNFTVISSPLNLCSLSSGGAQYASHESQSPPLPPVETNSADATPVTEPKPEIVCAQCPHTQLVYSSTNMLRTDLQKLQAPVISMSSTANRF